MKHCAQCSREYPDSSLFCTQCGLPLADGPAEPPAEAEGLAEPAAEPPAEAKAPAESAMEPPAEAKDPAEPAMEPLAEEKIPAPAAAEDAAVIVEAAPAAIEIHIPAPEAPAAVAVAEKPPAPPALTPPESASPREEKRRGGEKIGFGRRAGAFFLCIPLFLFLLIPAMIFQVRDASTKIWISNFLEKSPASDLIDLEGLGYALESWLQGLDPELENLEFDAREETSAINRFIDRANVKEFVARQLASYLDALYSGAYGAAFTKEDIADLMADNNGIINEQLSEVVDDLFGPRSGIDVHLTRADRNDLAERFIGELEDAGVNEYLDTDTMKERSPAVYYALRFGLSYIAAGLSLVLAIAIFICLVKTLKSALRAVNRAGIVLIVLGGALTLLSLFPKQFADLWLSLFNEAHVLALFAEEFFYTHILMDLIILGAGVLLTAVTGLALNIQKRRAAS